MKAKIAIAPDCRLGLHAVRIRTASGIEQSASVGGRRAAAKLAEVEPNSDFAQPQKIALDTTINGVVQNEDVDYLPGRSQEGGADHRRDRGDPPSASAPQRRSSIPMWRFWTRAVSSWPAATIRRCSSKMRRSSAHGPGRRHLCRSGSRQLLRRQRRAAAIACTSAAFRDRRAVFPAGGRPGETLEVHWLGDVAGERVETVTLPPAADPDFGLIAARRARFCPLGRIRFRLVDFGNVLEVEPNDQPATATPFTVPMAVQRRDLQARRRRLLQVRRQARGKSLDVRVFARQLGSPLDPQIGVHKADGGGIAGNDDSGGPDSYLRFTLPDDGEYLVAISDQLGHGGVDYVYRIEVTPVTPSLSARPARAAAICRHHARRCRKAIAWRRWFRPSGSISAASCN